MIPEQWPFDVQLPSRCQLEREIRPDQVVENVDFILDGYTDIQLLSVCSV